MNLRKSLSVTATLFIGSWMIVQHYAPQTNLSTRLDTRIFQSLQIYAVNRTQPYKISLTKGEQRMLVNSTEARRIKDWAVKYLNETGRSASEFSLVDKGPFNFIPDLKNPCWYNEMRELRCLPFFYLIGFTKCGTTDIYHMLRTHSDFISEVKEPLWYFPDRFRKDLSFDWYTKLIAQPLSSVRHDETVDRKAFGTNSIMGDLSACTAWGNTYWPVFVENSLPLEPELTNADYVHHLNKKTKIIAIIRNPVTRLYSEYTYFKSQTGPVSPQEFHQLVIDKLREFNDCLGKYSIRSCVYSQPLGFSNQMKVRIGIGIYFIHLQEWYRLFPKEQILILRFEDYRKDRTKTVQKMFSFLTLRNIMDSAMGKNFIKRYHENTKIFNANKYKNGSMLEETRFILYRFFKPFNQALARMLNNEIYDYGPY